VDPSLDEGSQLPDGVLVVRAVRGVAGGRQAFRVTEGSAEGGEPTVTVVSELRALHDLIDAWASALRSG
jgi:hypothetical protein